MTRTALILGAHGRFGRHAAAALGDAGWTIRPFDRRSGDLDAEAQGADLIVNGWNPPYTDWQDQVPRLTKRVIAAAEASGATILQPGNVYVFGAEASPRFAPDTPHRATNPLGRIRIAMEERYRQSSARVILLRAGDFLDTEASGNWFDKIIATNIAKGRMVYPGNPNIPHAWAFLPDLARAAAALAERRETLPRYADIPFRGHTLSGEDLRGLCAEISGRPVRLKRMSWLPLRVASLVWPMGRKLVEMRYLWDKPHEIDGAKFDALLPEFRPSTAEEALRAAVSPLLKAG